MHGSVRQSEKRTERRTQRPDVFGIKDAGARKDLEDHLVEPLHVSNREPQLPGARLLVAALTLTSRGEWLG